MTKVEINGTKTNILSSLIVFVYVSSASTYSVVYELTCVNIQLQIPSTSQYNNITSYILYVFICISK